MIWRSFTRHSDRLVLRRYKRADAAVLPTLLDDWQVARWLARTPHPYTVKDGRDWIKIARSVLNRGKGYALAIVEKESGKLIGGVGLSLETGEIGYWFGRDHWGKGYATEVVEMVTQIGFGESELPKLWAMVLPGNDASRRVLEKVGYASSGTRPYAFRNGERTADYFHLQRWEWQAVL